MGATPRPASTPPGASHLDARRVRVLKSASACGHRRPFSPPPSPPSSPRRAGARLRLPFRRRPPAPRSPRRRTGEGTAGARGRPLPEGLSWRAWASLPDLPVRFTCEVTGHEFQLGIDGRGTWRRPGRPPRPVEVPLVDSGDVASVRCGTIGDDAVLVLGLADDKSLWGELVRLSGDPPATRWIAYLPAAPAGEPLLAGHHLYLAAGGFAGKLDADTGRLSWSHRGPADAEWSERPELDGGVVTSRTPPAPGCAPTTRPASPSRTRRPPSPRTRGAPPPRRPASSPRSPRPGSRASAGAPRASWSSTSTATGRPTSRSWGPRRTWSPWWRSGDHLGRRPPPRDPRPRAAPGRGRAPAGAAALAADPARLPGAGRARTGWPACSRPGTARARVRGLPAAAGAPRRDGRPGHEGPRARAARRPRDLRPRDRRARPLGALSLAVHRRSVLVRVASRPHVHRRPSRPAHAQAQRDHHRPERGGQDGEVLDAIRCADEVLVVDGGSTDGTREMSGPGAPASSSAASTVSRPRSASPPPRRPTTRS